MYKIFCLGIFFYFFLQNVVICQVANQKYYITEPTHQYNIRVYADDEKGILIINKTNDTSKISITCKGEWGFKPFILGKQNDRLINQECPNGFVGELVGKNTRGCNYISVNSNFVILPKDSISIVMNDYNGEYEDNWGYLDGTLSIVTNLIPQLPINKPTHKLEESSTKKKVQEKDTITNNEEISKIIINKNHKVYCASKVITLIIWDEQKEDGDIIDIYINNDLIFDNFELTTQPKIIKLPLTFDKELNIFIKAVNTGKIPPCTSTLKIEGCDLENPLVIQSDLLSTERITLYRSEF